MLRPLRVLIVEDNDDDVTLLLRELRRGEFEPLHRCVETALAFEQALNERSWDLVIADYSLPGFSGMAALELLKSKGQDIPFILISGTIPENLAVDVMKTGAHDYLMKGHLARLIPTIERELRDAEERRDRRLAHRSLRETHQNMEALIKAAPFAIISLNLDGEVQVWNPAAERLFGWTEREAVGRPMPFVDEADRDAYPVLFGAQSADIASDEIDVHGRHRAGMALDLIVNIAPLRDANDEQNGLIAIVADVTQRKLLEAQLRQSQKMEAIGQLAGGVAHDFNNLLQAILGYTDLALQTLPADSPARNDLNEALAAAQKAAQLTSQLLAHGRRQTLQPRDININQLIAEFTRMLRRMIGEHIHLEFIQGHQIGTVHADPGQMEQVIMNLCVNARDAMPEGGTIMIETENVTINNEYRRSHPWASEGRYLLLTVSDTGAGMDAATQARIFEPFFTTKPKDKGTGLGLATVYGIIKQHNGFVYVYSEVAKGTTFKIYLPIVERRAIDVGRKIEAAVSGGNETILIAEDSESVRALAVRVLQEAGYHTITAVDGAEAVALYETHADRIALVVLDVIMPKLYGRMVYERIKKMNPSARVLFCSGYSANGLHTEFIAAEGAQLIQKPYNPKALLHKVRELLDKQG